MRAHIRHALSLRLVRDGLAAYGLTGATLAVNLVTGILIARVLGTTGRGELTSVLVLGEYVTTLFALGSAQAVAYHQSRRPQDAPRLLAAWMVFSVPLGLVAILVAELLIPILLGAQSDEVQHLARLYVIGFGLMLWMEPVYGTLLGDQDFMFWNKLRFVQPLCLAIAYGVLALVGTFTVASAVLATFLAALGANLVVMIRILRRHPLARPGWQLGLGNMWVGLRGFVSTITETVNARLDLLIMPAFLAASSIGLYAVATNVSWIVVLLSGALHWLVLPAAARAGQEGYRAVISAFQATIAVGVALAAPLALLAGPALTLVYGQQFAGAATPLRILLIGSVLLPAAGVLSAGIYGLGHPLAAAIPHVVGAVVTATGLLLFLEAGGIEAAAIVTTVAYATAFVIAILVYRRMSGVAWAAFRKVHLRGLEPTAEPAGIPPGST